MTALGHIAGASLVRGNPVVRVVGGFATHWLMDKYFPEYFPEGLKLPQPKTWLKYWWWLLAQVGGVLAFCYLTGDWWAILYGMVPDIIEGLWIGYNLLVKKKDIWTNGELFFPFHKLGYNTRPQWNFLQTFTLEIALSIVAMATFGAKLFY